MTSSKRASVGSQTTPDRSITAACFPIRERLTAIPRFLDSATPAPPGLLSQLGVPEWTPHVDEPVSGRTAGDIETGDLVAIPDHDFDAVLCVQQPGQAAAVRVARLPATGKGTRSGIQKGVLSSSLARLLSIRGGAQPRRYAPLLARPHRVRPSRDISTTCSRRVESPCRGPRRPNRTAGARGRGSLADYVGGFVELLAIQGHASDNPARLSGCRSASRVNQEGD